MINSVTQFMSDDHRHCDELFNQITASVNYSAWEKAREQFAEFKTDLLYHFDCEETILFPSFESATGNSHGPSAMMRLEHSEMKKLIDDIQDSIQAQDSGRFYGLYEVLTIYLQQHNLKEEGILYPMIDSECENTDELIKSIFEHSKHRAA